MEERSAVLESGIGAPVLRKEDSRHLHGRGRFVGDIRMPGMLEAALLRSPVAHARLLSVRRPATGRVFLAEDLKDLAPIVPPNNAPGAQLAPFPVLAAGKLRFVGEPVAVAVAESRAKAEDLAEAIEIDFEQLPALMSVEQARAPGAPLVHEDWHSNVIKELELELGDLAVRDALAQAPIKVSGRYSMARQSMNPMEGKGCLAFFDDRLDQLVLYSSTQVPHLIRDAVSDALRIARARVRVIAPDVGGGFGYKSILQAEEVLVAWLALKLRRPVRYLEDRREHLIAAANTREQHYDLTAYADRDGRLLGLTAQIDVDAGAYSAHPFTNMLDAGMAVGNMTGPYRVPYYHGVSRGVATNKPPAAPYRGVARPGACFAIEQLLDEVAAAAGKEPWEVRGANLVAAAQMPFTTLTGKTYDTGDYHEALTRLLKLVDAKGLRARQAAQQGNIRIGLGIAFFVELTGHSPRASHDWKLPVRAAAEPATVRLNADGGLEIRLGLQSHGQGMETTMAQVAHEVLGISLSSVTVNHGDTGMSGFSTGTYASRGMVVGAGAVAGACRRLADRLRTIGAALWNCPLEQVTLGNATLHGPGKEMTLAALARAWHEDFGSLRDASGCDSLEANYGYEMTTAQGVFTYGAHAAVVEIDVSNGHIRVVDYAVVEDCGTVVNPLIVDGQVIGGSVQGIGSALYEQTLYDPAGQPTGSTLVDYLLPGAGDVPMVRIDHMSSPSPHTEFGIKGVGEGGAIPSTAAVASAVNDALSGLASRIRETPMTPARVLQALAECVPEERPSQPVPESEPVPASVPSFA